MAGNNFFNMSDPVNPHDVATKKYPDNIKGGGWVKTGWLYWGLTPL